MDAIREGDFDSAPNKPVTLEIKIHNQFRQALVDTGAQISCIKSSTAKSLMMGHLIDSDHAGVMQGVGTQKFIGKIHLVRFELEGIPVCKEFYVLDQMPAEIVIGIVYHKKIKFHIFLKTGTI